jgi:hypothetical protein
MEYASAMLRRWLRVPSELADLVLRVLLVEKDVAALNHRTRLLVPEAPPTPAPGGADCFARVLQVLTRDDAFRTADELALAVGDPAEAILNALERYGAGHVQVRRRAHQPAQVEFRARPRAQA